MTKGLEAISEREYLGRIIIIGRTREGTDVVAYAVTGRSPSSQARKLVEVEPGTIKTEPTNPEVLDQGIRSLLVYNCTRMFQDSVIVSNGAQTDLISQVLSTQCFSSPTEVLVKAFSRPYLVKGDKKVSLIDLTSYEPDAPNWTPRISGLLIGGRAAMSIIKCDDGKPERHYFEFPLENGYGRVIATYTGENVMKGAAIPSFKGEPQRVNLDGEAPEDIAQHFYDALGPMWKTSPKIIQPGEDFRVGVAVVTLERIPYLRTETGIINRVDLEAGCK